MPHRLQTWTMRPDRMRFCELADALGVGEDHAVLELHDGVPADRRLFDVDRGGGQVADEGPCQEREDGNGRRPGEEAPDRESSRPRREEDEAKRHHAVRLLGYRRRVLAGVPPVEGHVEVEQPEADEAGHDPRCLEDIQVVGHAGHVRCTDHHHVPEEYEDPQA